eukprot:TRINITY_DN4352_c0_g1_i1.p1 TRINITY_DN4352_c0_g1~~TRINITY_DN4352_c0_g1_i1.p1  ORF type:complete len:208 (-),score=42.46 TRINITY_DN4352_c0_g1_i1:287-874(-)
MAAKAKHCLCSAGSSLTRKCMGEVSPMNQRRPQTRGPTINDVVKYGERLIELAIRESLDELREEVMRPPPRRRREGHKAAAADEEMAAKTVVVCNARGVSALKQMRAAAVACATAASKDGLSAPCDKQAGGAEDNPEQLNVKPGQMVVQAGSDQVAEAAEVPAAVVSGGAPPPTEPKPTYARPQRSLGLAGKAGR